ncbi:hypothetical protein H0H92_014724 [Tricholoma furcatifolium]|nr:hypothetical protein H0H92_014724 [Tricholoma furcatifolium]
MPTETKRNSQDDQIEYLESQVEAYKARVSTLQQKHLSALDALDEVLQSHKQELDQERTARMVAESRLQKCKSRVIEAENERDESKAAVLELINQGLVERTRGDLKHWPRSTLSLSANLDPLEPPTIDNIADQSLHDAGQDTLRIGALVDRLKRELSFERQTHAQTRAHVNVLAAQVANRDAALERWAQHATTAPILPASVSNIHDARPGRSKKVHHQNHRDLDRGEMLTLFEEMVAHNKSLEREVLMLSETTVIQRLSKQVDRLSFQIDAFTAERAALTGVIESRQHESDGEEETVTPCMTPRDPSMTDSYNDLDSGTSYGDIELASHENELEDEMIRRHLPPDQPDNHADGVDVAPVASTAEGDITDGGERSMEISTTPLFPTLVTFSDFAPSGEDVSQLIEVEAEHKPEQRDELEEFPGDDEIRMIRPRRLTPTPP